MATTARRRAADRLEVRESREGTRVARPSPVPEATSKQMRMRVLVVVDDVRTGRVLSRLLMDDGYEVTVARGGKEGLKRLLRVAPPDGPIADPRLERNCGLELAKRARAARPTLPVVFLSDYANLTERARDLDPSPRILVKPIQYDELARTLRSVA